MLLPLICLAIALIVSRVPVQRRLRAVSFCLLGVIALGLFVRFWGLYFLDHPSQTFLVPRSQLDIIMFFTFGITGKYTEDFAIGMLIGLLYIYSQNPSAGCKLWRNWQRSSSWLWGFGIVVLVFWVMWHFNHLNQRL